MGRVYTETEDEKLLRFALIVSLSKEFNTYDTAGLFGVSQPAICYVLRRCGIDGFAAQRGRIRRGTSRGMGSHTTDSARLLRYALMKELHKEFSLREIGEMLDVSQPNVGRVLYEWGCDMSSAAAARSTRKRRLRRTQRKALQRRARLVAQIQRLQRRLQATNNNAQITMGGDD